MHILLISPGNFFSNYGGGQVYVKNIAEEFIRQGMQISILACDPDCGASCIYQTYRGKRLYTLNPHLLGNEKIKNLITEIRPTVLHIHAEKALFCRIAQEMRLPCIVTAHHGGILCPAGTLLNHKDKICSTTICHKNCLPCYLRNIRSGKYWYPVMRLLPEKLYLKIGEMLRHLPFIPFITPIGQAAIGIEHKKNEWNAIIENANLVIAPSHAIACAMARNGLDKEKILVIPHGIPLPSKTIASTVTETDSEVFRFFYVGRICRVKGIHILLEAFSNAAVGKAELHLIGGTGNKAEMRYMKRLQKQYVHNRQIIWHGKVNPEQVFEMIKEYQALIHPAICLEVFGLNIAEALAMGKPVLSTRCGGAEMQIKEGVNGWLVEPNDVMELKNKIEEVISQFSSFKPNSTKIVSIEEHCKTLIDTYACCKSQKQS